jgi:hypothetical protein
MGAPFTGFRNAFPTSRSGRELKGGSISPHFMTLIAIFCKPNVGRKWRTLQLAGLDFIRAKPAS